LLLDKKNRQKAAGARMLPTEWVRLLQPLIWSQRDSNPCLQSATRFRIDLEMLRLVD
jgi:hypothetical protein